MIQRVVDLKADVKLIITLRTEYYGRLLDHLRAGRRDFSGVRDELLRDFSLPSLIAAIERPRRRQSRWRTGCAPRAKYGFRFAEGVAAKIAEDGLSLRTEHQDSVLPLIQVICTQLYDRKKAQRHSDGVISRADLEAIRGVEGGLKAFAEDALERSLGLGPADRAAFKSLFTRLYSRQIDGTLTTWLAPRDALESAWNGSIPFAQVMESARSVRLLREDVLRVEGNEPRPFIRLGHDALAKVASVWEEELLRGARFRRLAAMTMGSMALAGSLAVLACWAVVERARADKARQRAVAAKNEAIDYLGQSMDTLDQSFIKISEIDLADVPGMVRTRERLLSDADRGYHELLDKYRAGAGTNFGAVDLKIRWGMGRAFRSLGDIERQLGDLVHSYDHLKKAIELLENLPEGAPAELNYRRDLARAYHGKGETLRLRGDYVGSEADFDKAIALREGSLDDPEDIRSLAASHHSRAALLAQFPPRYAEAEGEYRRAIELIAGRQIESNVAENPVGENLLLLARYKGGLARLKQEGPRLLDQAKLLHEQVLEILDRQLPEAFRKQPGVRWQRARCRNNMGKILYNQRSQKDAEQGAETLSRSSIWLVRTSTSLSSNSRKCPSTAGSLPPSART